MSNEWKLKLLIIGLQDFDLPSNFASKKDMHKKNSEANDLGKLHLAKKRPLLESFIKENFFA